LGKRVAHDVPPGQMQVMDICRKRKDRPKLTMEKLNSTDRHTLE